MKFFWALPVYVHYEDEGLKVWEITQKTIRDQITALAADEDFGNPNHYDIKVSRTGMGLTLPTTSSHSLSLSSPRKSRV